MQKIQALLLVLLATTFAVAQNVTVTCSNFASDTNISSMRMEANGSNVNLVIGKCPEGQRRAPPPKNSSNQLGKTVAGEPTPPAPNNTNPPSPPSNQTQPQNQTQCQGGSCPNPQNQTGPQQQNQTGPQPQNQTGPQPQNQTGPQGQNQTGPGQQNNTKPPPADPPGTIPLATCTSPLKSGEDCDISYPEQCESKICVNSKCSQAITTGTCKGDADTAEGFYCKNGTVVAAIKVGEPCTGFGQMECIKGMCNKKTLICMTYKEWFNSLDLPALQGGDDTGFKTCTSATADQDCIYNTSTGLKKASEVNKGCIATLYANPVQYFCEMGGGEEIFRRLVKNVNLFRYLIFFSLMKNIQEKRH